MSEAFLCNAVRTPFGRYAGALAKVRPDDLLGAAIKSLLDKSAFKAAQIEDIIVGCANQSGEDSRCVARHAGLAAGLPIEIPGTEGGNGPLRAARIAATIASTAQSGRSVMPPSRQARRRPPHGR